VFEFSSLISTIISSLTLNVNFEVKFVSNHIFDSIPPCIEYYLTNDELTLLW
jgi:DNA-binding HxlR family transcriptional regulator